MHGNKRIRVELERGQCLLNVARFSRETGWGRKLISKSFEIISKWHTELHTEAMSFGLIITVKDYDKITKMDSEGATKDNARTTQGQRKDNSKNKSVKSVESDKSVKKEILSKDSTSFGNADVNFVINAFKEVFGFEPSSHRGQNARQTAWAYTQKLRKVIREKKGKDFIDSDELFQKATRRYFEWILQQEWSENVVSLRPMLVHLYKFLQQEK
jgi:hypothetical protein